MTGGVDEDYGSSNSSQVPTEGSDEERIGDVDLDGAAEQPESSAEESDLEEIPRHTKPFRAWGAAHEDAGPSIWERFVAWVRSLFSRKKTDDETVGFEETAQPAEFQEGAVLVEPIAAEELPPPTADAEPLWDTPVVAQPSQEAPPSLEASDFSDVLNQRKSPLDGIDWKSLEEQPAKQGFFARLFSRKKRDEPVAAYEEVAEDLTTREPADADFAMDPVAAAAPAHDDFAQPAPVEDDFAEEEPVNPPSLDHSAADSASLAALLGSTPTIDEPIDVPVEQHADAEISEPIESPVEATIEPVAEERPIVPDTKKAGFFSGLLKRVSRSQFIPKAATEPEPEPIPAAMPDVPVMPEVPVMEAAPEVAAVEEIADLGETVPHPMPAVPPPTPAAALVDELETTQPFTAFRDARDDFAEEEAANKSRATEKVDVPAADEGDKTDEFDLVPNPAEEMDRTAETRLVPGFFGRMFSKKAESAASTSGDVPAIATDDAIPFVLAKFRAFYNEVIRDKHQKSDVISGFATAVMGAGGAASESDPEFSAQLLSKRLSEMLELQAAESNWKGGDAAKYYPEAQYAMVALADETFATIDWPGRSSWHKYMLEPKMFGTRAAELEFFKRIDKLLKEAPDEKGARDLARLYLMVIASGYRGKFRVPNVRRPLAEYRRRLYEYSHQADPLELYARDRKVFPQAVAHTLVSRSVGRFTPAQKWVAVVLVLAVLYIGVSHYAWTSVSADLRDVMSRIQSSISQPTPPR